MNIEQIAKRYDNRAGYTLISYGPVGLPVFRLITTGLCLNKKKLDPIEEFVLRGVSFGIESVGNISGLLGLEESVIESCLSELIRTECIQVSNESSTAKQIIKLTSKGKKISAEQEQIIPLEQTVVFCVDGLTRKPQFYPLEGLFKPRELKDLGVPEVRPFPARPPELHEIDIKDVIEIVRLDAGKDDTPRQLLQITSIERRDRVFLDAVALAYRAEEGVEIQVDFAIDGRLAREHGQAFARANGVEKSKLFRGLLDTVNPPSIAELIGEDISKQVKNVAKEQSNPKALQNAVKKAREKISIARIEAAKTSISPTTTDLQYENRIESDELTDIEHKISGLQVRPLAVYEHATLLKDAIDTAKDRLLIISPWIRRAVVNQEFIRFLKKTLDRGVNVYIGYGLGNEDDGEKKRDADARKDLEKLMKSYDRFFFKRTGDTHAKVLIKDHDYFIITSFNWLSFKGDPHRTFREEWGTLVAIPNVVDEYFKEMVERFN